MLMASSAPTPTELLPVAFVFLEGVVARAGFLLLALNLSALELRILLGKPTVDLVAEVAVAG